MKHSLSAVSTILLFACSAFGKNPLFFGADPSGLVSPDGRMWIYPTTDEPNWADQVDWHAWSSSDLVNWTDHGVIFSMQDSGWATKFAWAPDCVFKGGRYYLYYYFNKGNPGGGVGVAVSDRPEGPFKEARCACQASMGPPGAPPYLLALQALTSHRLGTGTLPHPRL